MRHPQQQVLSEWQQLPRPHLRIISVGWFLAFGFIAFLRPPAASATPLAERIVGGGSAAAGQFPFMVSLRTLSSNSHFCGGTIQTSRYILSAAHCVTGKAALNVKVVAGSIYLASGGASYSVTAITIHPNFNAYTYLNDIAVLKTASAITFTEAVQPLGISASFMEENLNAAAIGWGLTSLTGSNPDDLQWIQLRTISNTLCKSFHSATDSEKITEASLCTHAIEGQGVCTGDSGGPLVYGNELVGIVSWGIPCAKGKPDVYTRISSVFNWIDMLID